MWKEQKQNQIRQKAREQPDKKKNSKMKSIMIKTNKNT